MVFAFVSASASLPERLLLNPIKSAEQLNQNSIEAIHEDAYGFLWIGTQSGLHLYDGERLTLYQHSIDAPNGLFDSFVVSISSSPTGQVWVATLNGVSVLERHTMSFKQIVSYEALEANGFIQDIEYLSEQQALYVVTSQEIGRYSIADNRYQVLFDSSSIQKIKNTSNQITSSSVSYLIDQSIIYSTIDNSKALVPAKYSGKLIKGVIKDEEYYFLAEEQVVRLNKKQIWESVMTIPKFDKEVVTDIALDSKNRLWISTNNNGVFAASLTNKMIEHYNNNNSTLSDDRVKRLYISSDSLLWVGTYAEGILSFDMLGQLFGFHYPEAPEQAGFNNVRAIIDDNNNLLIGANDGLVKLDKRSKKRLATVPMSGIMAFAKKDESSIWVGARDGLYLYNTIQSTLNKVDLVLSDTDNKLLDDTKIFIRSLSQFKHYLIIATNEQGLLIYNNLTEKIEQQIYIDEESSGIVNSQNTGESSNTLTQQPTMLIRVLVDDDDRLWIGTLKSLWLTKLHIENDGVVLNDLNKLIDNTIIRDIVQVTSNEFYVGTHSGLAQVKVKSLNLQDIIFYSKKDGLADSTIYSVSLLDNRYLWLSTNRGLSVLQLNDKVFINYDNVNSLGQLEFNGAAKLQAKDGLYFGGVRGITWLSEMGSSESIIKPVWITRLGFGENFSKTIYFPEGKQYFHNDENVINLSFSSSHLSPNVNAVFRYKLNEQPWVHISGSDDVVLAGLEPDSYTFELQAKIDGGDWQSASNKLELVIMPSVYQTLWAKIIYALLVVAFLSIIAYQEVRRRRLRKLAFERVKSSEDRLKMALTASEQGLWDWIKAQDKVFRFNVKHLFSDKTNSSRFDFIDDVIHEKDKDSVQQERKRFLREKDEFDVQYRVMTDSGRWRWIHDKGKVIEYDKSGEIIRATGTYTDITHLKRAQLESVLSNEIIRSMTEAVVVLDKDREVTFVNPAFCRITGYSLDDVKQSNLDSLRSEKHSSEFYRKLWRDIESKGTWFGEFWMCNRKRKNILCSLEAFHIDDDELEEHLSVLIFSNITEKRMAEEKLSYLARYDSLTGLPNRNLFSDRLQHAIALARRHEHKIAVMFIDLDGFKKVNDSFGHQVGDHLLKKAAEIISACIRSEDTLARLSGDEFLLIIEEYESEQQLSVVADKILELLEQPIDLGQTQVVISCSIGISQFPKDSDDAESLMKYSDTAMYYAKNQGKGAYYFYQDEMHSNLIHRLNIEQYLRDAVKNDEFLVLFQPIVDVQTQSIVSAEALIRWHNSVLGEVYPSDFIPLAEETGYIIEIGRFVIETVCKELSGFNNSNITIAVNVSVRQLMHEGFVSSIRKCLDKYKIVPSQLKIEITESLLMTNASQTSEVIKQLKEIGLTISVDDFGTGYSSLSYLKRFYIDELKIDKEFISDIIDTSTEEKVVNAIMALAKSLGMKVVAEGVETEVQLNYLRSHECDYAQGYYFSRPCELSTFKALLKNNPFSAI